MEKKKLAERGLNIKKKSEKTEKDFITVWQNSCK